MASEGLFSGCWTPATLRTFQVPLRASQLKVKAFYTRVGALADLKISKACRNIYRRIFSGGVIAWHGRNDLRDTTGLPFAKLTRIDIPVRLFVSVGQCNSPAPTHFPEASRMPPIGPSLSAFVPRFNRIPMLSLPNSTHSGWSFIVMPPSSDLCLPSSGFCFLLSAF